MQNWLSVVSWTFLARSIGSWRNGATASPGSRVTPTRALCVASAALTAVLVSAISDAAIASKESTLAGGACDIRAWMTGLATTPGFRWSSCGTASAGVRAGVLVNEGGVAAIYATGCFTHALDEPVGSVVRWDGASWSTVGEPPEGRGQAIVAWQEDSTTMLAVAGMFGNPPVQSVHLYDGVSWNQLGDGPAGAFEGTLSSLARQMKDGTASLVVGGSFAGVGGVAAANIARWSNGAWSAMGSGVSGPVSALVAADLGGGPSIVAGGNFLKAGATTVNRIARWDEPLAQWIPLGGGANHAVQALAVLDEGDGPRLWAGGAFTTIGGVPASRLANWDGATWTAAMLPPGTTELGTVDDLGTTVIDGLPTLLVGDGSLRARNLGGWIVLGGISGGSNSGKLGGFAAATEFPDLIVVVGAFTFANGRYAPGAAQWDGAELQAMPSDLGGFAADAVVYDLLPRDLSPRAGDQAFELIIAGAFQRVGGVVSPAIARWTRAGFDPVGASSSWRPEGAAFEVTSWPDRAGVNLLAAGTFEPFESAANTAVGLARFDGVNWTPMAEVSHPPDRSPIVVTSCVFDDGSGPSLVVGGQFTSIDGVEASRIARFDGRSWHAMGSGFDDGVLALATFDDGGGPALYAGGFFTTAGGQSAPGIARWDGEVWSAVAAKNKSLAAVTGGSVWALRVHDDGSGPALYAAGLLGPNVDEGGWPGTGVHRWDGTAWSQVGGAVGGLIYSLEPWNDNGVQRLVAAGALQTQGQTPTISGAASWDGVSWSPVGSPSSAVSFGGTQSAGSWQAMAELPDGRLVGGGSFGYIGTAGTAPFLAAFGPAFTPFVYSSPKDTTVQEGNAATLEAQVGIWPSAAALELQWHRNGVPLVDGPEVIGAGELELTLLNVDHDDAGSYDLVAVGECGSETTLAAQLTVTCATDASLDGAVDGADLGLLLAAWGATDSPFDFNSDGAVDENDLAELLAEWGECG